jgi:hypothetical protein
MKTTELTPKTSRSGLRQFFTLHFSLFALIVAAMFTSCDYLLGEEEEEDTDEQQTTVVVTLEEATVAGIVTDTKGAPLQGVSITSGSLSTTTGTDGRFALTKIGVVDDRSVVRFEKSGYFPIVRSGVKREEIFIEAIMQKKDDSSVATTETFSATDGAHLEVAGMEVDIPSGSLVTADGNAYTGSVRAEMFYLEPNNENFDGLMPGGDLMAERTNGADAMLISYGMVSVELTGSGKTLQLADGAESELTFPIPAGMETNPPATIPLWSFDEDRGLWVEEGTATRQGNVYVGRVKHFSWHNLDYPEDIVDIRGTVRDCSGDLLPFVKVTAFDNAGRIGTYTNSAGEYRILVPSNTPVTLTVLSKDYYGYQPEAVFSIPGMPGKSTVTQDIGLPCTDYITGEIVNTCGTVIAARLWIEYTENGQLHSTTPQTVASTDGTFRLRTPSYRGPATIYAESLDGANRASQQITIGSETVAIRLSLCMTSASGLLITATDASGEGFALAIPDESFKCFVFSSVFDFPKHEFEIRQVSSNSRYGGQFTEDYAIVASFMDYTPDQTHYVTESENMWATAGLVICEGTNWYQGAWVIDAYGVEYEIVKRSGHEISISITADGEYWIPGGGSSGGFPVHIEGVITATLAEYEYSYLDVAPADFPTIAAAEMAGWDGYQESWEEWIDDDNYVTYYGDRAAPPVFDPAVLPVLPYSIDELFTKSGEGHRSKYFSLHWWEGDRERAEAIVAAFRTAGFNGELKETTVNVYESGVGFVDKQAFRAEGSRGDVSYILCSAPGVGYYPPSYGTNSGRSYDADDFDMSVTIYNNKLSSWY